MKFLRSLAALVCLSAFCAPLAVSATDVSITASNVKPSVDAVLRRDWIAGESITAGQLVYRSASDYKIYKADCDSATAGVRDCIGIAVTSSANGAPVVVCMEDPNLILGGTTTNGTIYILSATAGGIAPAADGTTNWYVTVVAVGKSSTVVAFRARPLRSATAL